MTCPNCQSVMKTVKMPGVIAGYFVQIDQCSNCGGIWCDRYEMYQIPENEAIKLDLVDEQKLAQPTPETENIKCPKDQELLKKLVDVNIPEDTEIFRCHLCEGIWLNRGDLLKYKAHVKSRQTNIWQKKYEDENEKIAFINSQKALSGIGNSLMPLPVGARLILPQPDYDQPYLLSPWGVDLLKQVPTEKKAEIFRLMARDHEQEMESQKRFINATVIIINLIYRLFCSMR